MNKNIILSVLVFSFFILPVFAETLKVDKYRIEYDEVYEGDSDGDGINDRKSYYLDDQLVFASFDNDGDGKADAWFRYDSDLNRDLAMRDTSGNERPNDIVGYDENDQIAFEENKGFLSNLPYGWIIGVTVIVLVIVFFKKIPGIGKLIDKTKKKEKKLKKPEKPKKEKKKPKTKKISEKKTDNKKKKKDKSKKRIFPTKVHGLHAGLILVLIVIAAVSYMGFQRSSPQITTSTTTQAVTTTTLELATTTTLLPTTTTSTVPTTTKLSSIIIKGVPTQGKLIFLVPKDSYTSKQIEATVINDYWMVMAEDVCVLGVEDPSTRLQYLDQENNIRKYIDLPSNYCKTGLVDVEWHSIMN